MGGAQREENRRKRAVEHRDRPAQDEPEHKEARHEVRGPQGRIRQDPGEIAPGEGVPADLFEVLGEKGPPVVEYEYVRVVDYLLAQLFRDVEAELRVLAGPVGGIEAADLLEVAPSDDEVYCREGVDLSALPREVPVAVPSAREPRREDAARGLLPDRVVLGRHGRPAYRGDLPVPEMPDSLLEPVAPRIRVVVEEGQYLALRVLEGEVPLLGRAPR